MVIRANASTPTHMIGLLTHALRLLWGSHFKVPPAAYWAICVATAVFFSVETPLEAGLSLAAAGLGVQGLARWRWHRRKREDLALLVPLFAAESRSQAKLLQQQIVTSLRDRLPAEQARRVHSLPVTVGRADAVVADQLRRRLRAFFVLHGELRNVAEGQAVFARVLQPAEPTLEHWDWHTRDVTPAKTGWTSLVELLTPQRYLVADEEYPLFFAHELEALLEATEGQLAGALGEHERAVKLLRQALALAPGSESHQIDELRISLASALANLDRGDEALDLLRERARSATASPALLRYLAHFQIRQVAGTASGTKPPEIEEAEKALRRAAAHRGDIRRPMTLYNLSQLLLPDAEGFEINSELLQSVSHYRRVWYTRRTEGMRHWLAVEKAWERDEPYQAQAAEAGRCYSRAIRARPRFQLLWRGRLWARFDPSPILHANAYDAHHLAGHLLRAAWHRRRHRRTRGKFLRIAHKAMKRGNWERAYAYADWSVVGQNDVEHEELTALVWRAVARQQRGELAEAEADWDDVRDRGGPFALWLRAEIAHHEEIALPRGVPGSDTTDFAEIGALQSKALGV
jgi:tetratricopeptide (TPR) repeat protein